MENKLETTILNYKITTTTTTATFFLKADGKRGYQLINQKTKKQNIIRMNQSFNNNNKKINQDKRFI